MNRIIGLLIIAGLSGCGNRVEGWEHLASIKACEKHGGVDSITMLPFITQVTCRDSFTKTITRTQEE